MPRAVTLSDKDPNLSIQNGILQYHKSPFNGMIITLYENGLLYKKSAYLHGLKEGQTHIYWLNGSIKEIGNFAQGQRHDVQKGWFAEGPKKFEHHFKNGLLDGYQTQWHLGGSIFKEDYFEQGIQKNKKILFANGDIFTNYANRYNRIYGQDGGPLCMENKKREGQK
jgi:antitoxin component YwqK of YwqJK toxin-antitoxin module